MKEIVDRNQLSYSTALMCVILLGSFVYFFQLGLPSLVIFDEARLAVSALEMLISKNYWVVTFDGQPDLWSVKPPLMIWLQMLSYKIFGVNEFALRFPSATAGLITTVLVFRFCAKDLKSVHLGMIASFILMTIPGFFGKHVVRSGDYDSLLVLFLFLQIITFYRYSLTQKNNQLWLLALWVFLAVFTKSIAGLFFIPGFIVFIIWEKKWWVFRSAHLYLCVLSTLGLIAAYYFYREHLSEGYLQKVWENELGGRFAVAQEENVGPPWYYIKTLIQFQCSYWIWFFGLLLFPRTFKVNDSIQKNWMQFSILVLIVFGLIISLSATKLEWYDAPIFPSLSIAVALLVFSLYEALQEWKGFSFLKNKIRFYTIIFLIPILITIYEVVISPPIELQKQPLHFGEFSDQLAPYDQYLIFVNGYDTHIDFHRARLRYQDKDVNRCSELDRFKKGDLIAVGKVEYQDFLKERYQLKVKEESRNFRIYEVVAAKQIN